MLAKISKFRTGIQVTRNKSIEAAQFKVLQGTRHSKELLDLQRTAWRSRVVEELNGKFYVEFYLAITIKADARLARL